MTSIEAPFCYLADTVIRSTQDMPDRCRCNHPFG